MISMPSWQKNMHADVKILITRKCTNRLQLMDCKCEVDPKENCVFANKI
jgi:hypothetical protein